MDDIGLDHLNQIKNDETPTTINEILNNDCLMHIFNYLSIKEKLLMELVCKRWKNVSKQTWSHVKSLKIDGSFRRKYFQDNESHNTAFVIRLLKRCGMYLNDFCLKYDPKILNIFSNYCSNVTELKLKSVPDLSDENLKIIFEKNKNLKSISLKNLKFDASTFLVLNSSLIEKLKLVCVHVDSKEIFLNFLSRLTNLKILKLGWSTLEDETDFNSIINALNIGNIVNLTELKLFVSLNNFLKTNQFVKFFKRQKQLRKIHFPTIGVDFIDAIMIIDQLEEIVMDYDCDDFLNNLYDRFQNLKMFTCGYENFEDYNLINISKCLSLKKLCLKMEYYALQSEGENYFSKLQNLESLTITTDEGLCEDLLFCISKCKKLKDLKLNRLDFVHQVKELEFYPIKDFDSFPNLETFEIFHSDITDEILAIIISKSPKLRFCDIGECYDLTKNIINLINEIKSNPDDNQVLNIELYDLNFNKNDVFNSSPLISLKFW